VVRDHPVKADLERLGWRVVTVWECELRTPVQLTGRLDADLRQEKQSSGLDI
jgi:G:T-mismatch repair DNA endonuclease (very short patch repair protein)